MKMTLIAVFGVIGLVMLAFGAYEFYMQRRLMARSQPVQATITESGVSMSHDVSGDSSGPSTYSYSPQVKFRYELAGKPYESTLLRPLVTGRVYNSQAAASDELTAFPVGARVQAFVNPAYPDKAYLLREMSRGPVVFMGIGAGVLVVGMAVVRILKS